MGLENPGIRPRQGFDAWDMDGVFRFRTLILANVFKRKAAYFRVNQTGKVYRVVSRHKTIEVQMGRRAGDTSAA